MAVVARHRVDDSERPAQRGHPDTEGPSTARVDQWMWSVRLFRTRSAAADACRAGQVSINGRNAKPASSVRIGDRVSARVDRRQRIVEVRRIIVTRVAAAIAVDCYTDHSPPSDRSDDAPVFARDRGAGRPTKRDRRRLDDLHDR